MSYRYSNCRFCGSSRLRVVLDFGDVALAGGFVSPEEFADEKMYRLVFAFCEDCALVQIPVDIPPTTLFANYFYFSSAIATLRFHFEDLATEIQERFLQDKASPQVLEIGCNDGVLLEPLSRMGIAKAVGVDPATNVVGSIRNPAIRIINSFFSEELAQSIKIEEGRFDVLVACNVYAHLTNINSVTAGISLLLKDDGVFIFEVHYLRALLDEYQYDMIYHEHIFYYSLLALKPFLRGHELEIFDAKLVPIHAGSIRCFVGKKGTRSITDRYRLLENAEIQRGLGNIAAYTDYSREVGRLRDDLMNLLNRLKSENKKIYGYGASGRAATLIQFCGITRDVVERIIDDSPAKQGRFMPGSHIEITDRSCLKNAPPNYILVFAWSFAEEIFAKNWEFTQSGGRFIIPLPYLRVIPDANSAMVS